MVLDEVESIENKNLDTQNQIAQVDTIRFGCSYRRRVKRQ